MEITRMIFDKGYDVLFLYKQKAHLYDVLLLVY